MSLGNRHSARHDTFAMHKAAGVDATAYWAFQPGERVRVKEGFEGRVTEVQEGPVGGAEIYIVVLDGGVGGGEYDANELARIGGEVPDRLQANASKHEEPEDDWLGTQAAGQHVASDDYPELAEILVKRPPLAHSIRVGASKTAAETYGIRIGADGYYEDIGSKEAAYEAAREESVEVFGGKVYVIGHYGDRVAVFDRGSLVWERNASKTAAWVVTDDHGKTVYGPVDSSFAAQDAADQIGGDTHVQNVVDQQAYQGWGTGEEATVEMPYTASVETPVHIAGVGDALWNSFNNGLSDKNQFDPRGNYSYDWCRFRRRERCYYPKELDYEATRAEGYSVWVPSDRGFCPRAKWDQQRACTMAEPGPNSGEPNSLLDATIPYEEGGQRGGVPVRASLSGQSLSEEHHGMNCPACRGEGYGGPFSLPQAEGRCGKCDGSGNVDARRLATLLDLPTPTPHEADLLVTAAGDPEFSFHFTASWSDVQKKAKRIRSEGGVRILAVAPGSLTAEVKGDTAVYQTTLVRQAGRSAVDMWECGCKWASYAWGRSGRWKRYEGRMCSHALALTYEAAAQEWMGGTVQEQADAPDWSRGVKRKVDHRERPGAWQVGKPRRASLQFEAMPALKANPTIEEIVAWYEKLAHDEEPRTTSLFRQLAEHNMGEMEGLQFRFKEPDSIKSKIQRKPRGGDPRTWIKDALRYTMVFHPALYSAQVQDVLYGLQEAGYKIVEEENTWQRGDTYSALHYTLESPGGAPIELQFHTGESFTLKQKTLHKLYEEFRSASTPLRRKQELFDIMTAYWDKVEIPEGALDFPVEKRYMKPASHNPYLHQSLAATIKEAWTGQGVLVRFQGRILQLLALLPGRKVKLQGDIIASADEIVHAKWDPTEGLRLTGSHVIEANTVTFEEGPLYEMLGELALPPYPDGQGGVLAESAQIDCAPIAQHIQERVEQTRIALLDEDIFSEPVSVEAASIARDDGEVMETGLDQAEAEQRVQSVYDPSEYEVVSILHDEPEPALPTAEGEVVSEIPASEIDRHVQAALVAQGAASPPVANGLEWLMQGSPAQQSANADIAAGAREFLAKTAGKKFSPAEQRAIINEGEGVTAANLSDLDIAGTHYEALDAMSAGDGQLW